MGIIISRTQLSSSPKEVSPRQVSFLFVT